MKRVLSKLPLMFVLASPVVFAQYSYFKVDTTMAGPPSSGWTTLTGTEMLASPSGGANGGEVRAVVASPGFTINLATFGCYGGCSVGTASNFTTGYQLVVNSGSVALYSDWLNTVTSTLSYYALTSATTPTITSGTVVRAIARDDPTGGVDIIVYVNNALVLFYHDTTTGAVSTGLIGFTFSGSAATYVSEGDAGVLYSGAPNPIPSYSPPVIAYNYVTLVWAAASESIGGPGVYGYQILRDGVLLTTTTALTYTDLTTVPNSNYIYTVKVVDYHWNTASTNITVPTPVIDYTLSYPSSSPDGYRTGVKPTGTYWGAGNENIDVMSGNLSFSQPLLKAQARTSWSVPFNLSYNSQAWGQSAGGTGLQFTSDVGYGFGWRLMAGSITPIWSGTTASLYIFTDSSGAEYRLDQNTGNVWSSKESIYLYFDANLDILHFRDGSFWTMGCVSSASETDSGVMYPTLMEDTNGNQIKVWYNLGAGATWANSSARISIIADVRASGGGVGGGSGPYTYSFSYNSDSPTPHLVSIANTIATGEQYTFYIPSTTIASSITAGYPHLTAGILTSVTVSVLGVATSFEYNGYGEMTKATLPYGGYLAWSYDTVTYSSGIAYREVQNRYLSKDGTSGSQTTYAFSHESSVSTPIHQYTVLNDPGGVGQKYWAFGQSGVGMGLVSEYQGCNQGSISQPTLMCQRTGSVALVESDFTWVQDSVGNSYISSTLNTNSPNQTYAVQSKTTQSVDVYGNVLHVNNYNYGSLSTPARTTNYTYLDASAYKSRYILNRLLTASVTDGTTTTPLANNTYDGPITGGTGYYVIVTNPTLNWDTSYSPSVTTRGNMTQSITTNNTTITTYNQLGVVATVTSNGVAASVTTSNSNSYAAPSALTVGSLTTSLSWSSFLGLTNDTGPNGDSSSIYYDAYARQTSTTSPYGATTNYAYNSPPYNAANPAVITATISDTPGVNNRWTKTTLDGLGRTVIVQTGTGTTVISQTDTVYNSCGCSPTGKMAQQSLPHALGATPVWTTYTYDGIGRTLEVQTVGTGTTSTTLYGYWSNDVQVLDATNKWKTFQMDVFGNLGLVAEPDPANPTTSYYYTYYGYDLLNNLTSVSMTRPTGTQARSFVYNGKLLMSATNPENGTVGYTYNSYNKVATKTDAKGQATAYTYDTYARLIKVQRYPTGLSGSEDTCQQENYTYDTTITAGYSNYPAGRLTQVKYYGGFSSCNTTFTENYGYSQAGQKMNKGLVVTRGSATVVDLEASYVYDTEGRMTSIQYPSSGPNYTYAYDTMGRLNTMTNVGTSTTMVTGTTYDPANRLLSISGTVLSESRIYNTIGQLTNITSSAAGIPGSSLNITYNYSSTQNNGKITSQTDNISGEQVVYTYDSLNRLASAAATSSSWGQSYAYDGFGNLTNQTVTAGTSTPTLSVTYNASNNLQTTDCADANGNILVSGATYSCTAIPNGAAYSYDVSNRLHPPTLFGIGSFYSYAPGNKRVWRGTITSGGTTVDEFTFWGVNGQKLATYSVIYGGIVTTNAYFGSRLISNNAGNVATDRLGSVGKYYPWGQEKPSATTNGTEKFTGYFRDAETTLDYAKARYHQPGMGRFVTVDPYMASVGPADPGSWNRYAYTRGDPVNRVDHLGTCDTIATGDESDQEIDCGPGTSTGGGGSGGGSGSGGGGTSYTPDPAKTLADVNNARAYLTSNNWAVNPSCTKDLAALGLTASQVNDAVNNAQFGLSTDPGAAGRFDGTVTSIGLVLPLAVTPSGGNTVYFLVGATDPTYVATLNGYPIPITDAMTLALVVHESLHTLSQFDGKAGDNAMLNALGLSGTNSGPITTKLANDCFSGDTFHQQ